MEQQGCDALSALGRKLEAIVCCDRALEIDPRHANAWGSKGNALSDLGRNQEAIRCYDRLLEIDPKHADAWNNKGDALSRLGRKEEAIDCYDRSLEINPETCGHVGQQGQCTVGAGAQRGGYSSATTGCWRSTPEMRTRGPTRATHCGLWGARGGIACYDRALEIDPGHVARGQQGRCAVTLGRKEEAIALLRPGVGDRPQTCGPWSNKGLRCRSSGARRRPSPGTIDRWPGRRSCSAWAGKAMALWALGRREEAAAAYQRAKELIAELETSLRKPQ